VLKGGDRGCNLLRELGWVVVSGERAERGRLSRTDDASFVPAVEDGSVFVAGDPGGGVVERAVVGVDSPAGGAVEFPTVEREVGSDFDDPDDIA